MAVSEKTEGLLARIHELLDLACDEDTQAKILTVLSIAEDVILLGIKLLRKTL